MSSLNRLNCTGTTNRPVKLDGAKRETLLALAAGQAQQNCNRSRILARIQVPKITSPNISCDGGVLTFRLLMALRQEGNERMQRRRCREGAEKCTMGQGEGCQAGWSSLAEGASVIYTFPLFIDIS
jgi:hypothetical protein